MPELNIQLNVTDDENEDAKEEKSLMAILLKLKNAKSTIDQTRKRRHCDSLRTEVITKFENDQKELINKHTKRWSLKSNNLQQKAKKIKTNVELGLQKLQQCHDLCKSTLEKHKNTTQILLNSLSNFRTDYKGMLDSTNDSLKKEEQKIQSEIEEKLSQLYMILNKVQADSLKEDRFTKLIKTILVSF